MKNPNFQHSQENFDGDPLDSSDMTLVTFLKQHKPIAPPPTANFEQQLFAEISKYPQRSPNRNFKRWLPWALAIPVTLATGFGFNLATNRSQLQIATNQMSESEQAAIEQTLISSWNVSDDMTIQTTSTATTSDTQLLMELSPLEYE